MKGLLCPWAAEIIPDRQEAIAHTIHSATPGDVVLIAGKVMILIKLSAPKNSV